MESLYEKLEKVDFGVTEKEDQKGKPMADLGKGTKSASMAAQADGEGIEKQGGDPGNTGLGKEKAQDGVDMTKAAPKTKSQAVTDSVFEIVYHTIGDYRLMKGEELVESSDDMEHLIDMKSQMEQVLGKEQADAVTAYSERCVRVGLAEPVEEDVLKKAEEALVERAKKAGLEESATKDEVDAKEKEIAEAAKDAPKGDAPVVEDAPPAEEEPPVDDAPAEDIEPAPDAEKDDVVPDKSLLGGKADLVYYLDAANGKVTGVSDAEGTVVLDVEKEGIDLTDMGRGLVELGQKLEIDTLSYDLFMKYVFPLIPNEDDDALADEDVPPEEGTPPEEDVSPVEGKLPDNLTQKEPADVMGDLLEKYGLKEGKKEVPDKKKEDIKKKIEKDAALDKKKKDKEAADKKIADKKAADKKAADKKAADKKAADKK